MQLVWNKPKRLLDPNSLIVSLVYGLRGWQLKTPARPRMQPAPQECTPTFRSLIGFPPFTGESERAEQLGSTPSGRILGPNQQDSSQPRSGGASLRPANIKTPLEVPTPVEPWPARSGTNNN